METRLQLQVEKLEGKLRHCRRDNEYLRGMNTKSEVMIKIHKIQERFNEKKNSDQKNHIEKLSAQIKEINNKNDFNQGLKIKIQRKK